MRFSTKAEYGLKAMVNLARNYPAQKNIKAIAREENIPEKYLERLMNDLRKSEIILSQKGKDGGYTLTKKPTAIRVDEVVEILEGPVAPMKCVGKVCVLEGSCTSSVVWNKLAVQIKKTLHNIKLSELIK